MDEVTILNDQKAVTEHIKEELEGSKKPAKMGRPTKWRDHFCHQVYAMCKVGIKDADIATILDISLETFYDWKNNKSDFSDAIKKGKSEFDSVLVEKSLLNRAMGYDKDEVTRIVRGGEEYEVKTVTKHYAPDTRAMQMWLTNRDPNRWKDKQEVNHTGKIDNRIEIVTKSEMMTIEQKEDIGYIDTSEEVIEHEG